MDPVPPSSTGIKQIVIYGCLSIVGSFAGTYLFFTYALPAMADQTVAVTQPIETPTPVSLPLPRVISVTPNTNIISHDTLAVHFDTPMNTALTMITTDIRETGIWTDANTYQIETTTLKPNTEYAIRIASGSLTQAGATTTEDIVVAVHTAPAIAVAIGPFPHEQTITAPLRITFSQEMDKQSAEKAVHITPAAKGTFSWEDNTLIFTPKQLAYQTAYQITVATSAKPIRGFEAPEPTTVSFTTVVEEFKLQIPAYRQQYANSCEAASLRMALAYFGIFSTDVDITQAFGYAPRVKNIEENIWDDPQKMFVGFLDTNGSQKNQGYGVYGKPVAKAVEQFGRTAVYKTAISASELAKEIRAGHPVIAWGYTSMTDVPYTWKTPEGTDVLAFRGEHARLIVGVKGSVAHPLGFFVHDPINGNGYEYWSSQALFENMYAVPGVTNQLVIVK